MATDISLEIDSVGSEPVEPEEITFESLAAEIAKIRQETEKEKEEARRFYQSKADKDNAKLQSELAQTQNKLGQVLSWVEQQQLNTLDEAEQAAYWKRKALTPVVQPTQSESTIPEDVKKFQEEMDEIGGWDIFEDVIKETGDDWKAVTRGLIKRLKAAGATKAEIAQATEAVADLQESLEDQPQVKQPPPRNYNAKPTSGGGGASRKRFASMSDLRGAHARGEVTNSEFRELAAKL